MNLPVPMTEPQQLPMCGRSTTGSWEGGVRGSGAFSPVTRGAGTTSPSIPLSLQSPGHLGHSLVDHSLSTHKENQETRVVSALQCVCSYKARRRE